MGHSPEKSTLRIPFDTYDFFGYLFPGLTFIVCVLLFEHQVKVHHNFMGFFFDVFQRIFNYEAKLFWGYEIFIIAVIIAVVYIAGHIISAFSGFFIDRVFIFNAYGYPYQFLLNIPRYSDLKDKEECVNLEKRKTYYRSLFFWFNLFVLIGFLRMLFICWSNDLKSALIYTFISFLIFILLINFKWFKDGGRGIYDIITSWLSRFLHTRRGFSDDFILKYRAYFEENFGLKVEQETTNNYWLTYCYISEKSPVLESKVLHWLRLYSFARNISASFLLAFLYALIELLVYEIFKGRNFLLSQERNILVMLLPLCYYLLFLLMLLRYYYLYVCYLSKFLFRSFVYLNTQEEKIEKS